MHCQFTAVLHIVFEHIDDRVNESVSTARYSKFKITVTSVKYRVGLGRTVETS